MIRTVVFGLAGLLAIAGCPEAAALTGSWRGELNMGLAKLPLVFNFSEGADGTTVATMDSPQQNARGIPMTVGLCTADSVSLTCPMIGAAYNGRVYADRIEGVFAQRGYSFPLQLTPEESLQSRRPQTPVAPFPYIEVDTTFRADDGTELAATLTLPSAEQGRRFPTVVMVTGSGPQDRDETLFEHHPFAVIADWLARNGVASLRYDDRGTAKSKGDFASSTIETFAGDAASALRFARSLPQVGSAGLLGHSEGGTIAVLLAGSERPDYIVSLAGMVVPSRQTLLDQNRRSLERLGISGDEARDALLLVGRLFDETISQHSRGESSPIDVDSICRAEGLRVPEAVLASVRGNNASRNAYFDSLVSLDPTESLKSVACPVLAVNGTLDCQVDAEANLGAFRRYVAGAEIRQMEGLNHLMQHAVTGDVVEYGEIRETISPEVLELISGFINRRAGF